MKRLKFRKLAKKENGETKWFYYNGREHINVPTIYPQIVVEDLQFIGLQDKNGRNVYEGDVVLITPMAGEDKSSYRGVVEWVAPSFQIKVPKGKFPMLDDYVPMSYTKSGILTDFEVVGNVYQS